MKIEQDETIILSKAQQDVVKRFVAAVGEDDRVVAAFLGGSFAAGSADAQSDLDLYIVMADDAYDDYFEQRYEFMTRLGQFVFIEDFNEFGFDMLVFTLANGVEGELSMARESHFTHFHGGPNKTLVDKKGLLAGMVFPLYRPGEESQLRVLHKSMYWFWDNVSHFVTAMHRGQLWSAYGSLDEMRLKCLKLARLKHDFTLEHTGYSGVERIVPARELRPLEETCCAPEAAAMLEAALILVRFYRRVARPLGVMHDIKYPTGLDRVVSRRLRDLQNPAPAP
jgi:hypothetical protein